VRSLRWRVSRTRRRRSRRNPSRCGPSSWTELGEGRGSTPTDTVAYFEASYRVSDPLSFVILPPLLLALGEDLWSDLCPMHAPIELRTAAIVRIHYG
jgi:hypothetical protein